MPNTCLRCTTTTKPKAKIYNSAKCQELIEPTKPVVKILWHETENQLIYDPDKTLSSDLKQAQTRKHCCRNGLCQCWSQCCIEKQTGRKQNNFLFSRRKFYVFNICWMGSQTREYLEKLKASVFFLSVFQMFLRLRNQATYVEDTKTASSK